MTDQDFYMYGCEIKGIEVNILIKLQIGRNDLYIMFKKWTGNNFKIFQFWFNNDQSKNVDIHCIVKGGKTIKNVSHNSVIFQIGWHP